MCLWKNYVVVVISNWNKLVGLFDLINRFKLILRYHGDGIKDLGIKVIDLGRWVIWSDVSRFT